MAKLKRHRCGTVAIIGRPNVGKSTLLNHMLGIKLSIATRKPQTTRHQLLGIKTNPDSQIIFVDTPGLQEQPKLAINRYMNRVALSALEAVDLILVLIEANQTHKHDKLAFKAIKKKNVPVILILNKVDKLNDKSKVLIKIDALSQKHDFVSIVPMSARSDSDIFSLEKEIIKNLPIRSAEFTEDQISNRNQRFFAAEFIREKLTKKLGDELPYEIAVTIDEFKDQSTCLYIAATIWVQRHGQKKILIGKQGSVLKSASTQARKDMQNLFGRKVFLTTWVKIKKNWTDDEGTLRKFDYQ